MEDKESIAQAADILRRGGLLAIPTETVYGLAGNGLDPEAVAQIYEVKGRPSVKLLSLMVHDASAMAHYCAPVPQAAYMLAEAFWPGPLTIVLRTMPKRLPPWISPTMAAMARNAADALVIMTKSAAMNMT